MRLQFLPGLMIGLMLFLSGAAASAATPSFDCGKAQTAVEKTICRNADLAKADTAMATAYRDLSRKLTPSAAALLAKDQKWFLEARDYGFEFFGKDGAGMLQGWLSSRTKFLNEVSVAEPGRLTGHWGNVTGELEIKQAAGGGWTSASTPPSRPRLAGCAR